MGVWVDTDMGFDDLWALLMVAGAAPIDGVSLCFGCAALPGVRESASRAAAAFGWTFPIHPGAERPLIGPVITGEPLFGPTGMLGPALPEAPRRTGPPALDALAAWALGAPAPRRVLALGPLTNLATLWLARPEAAARIDEVVWMGGALTAGNQTASAEFNAVLDPEALAVLLERGAPLRMVELDACRRVRVGAEDVAAIRAGAHGRGGLLADLLAGYLGLALNRGRDWMALYDPVAAAVFLRPELGRYEPARIEVEREGRLTRGRTVIDLRPGAVRNASYLADLDAAAVRALCLEAVMGETGAPRD